MTQPITDNPPTPTPWVYRPQEHDDWGVIRTTVSTEDGWHPIVAVARYVGNPTDEDLGEHRRNKTDPTYANAAFIVRAVNNFEELVALAIQYRNDLRYPPAPDSVERRLAAIEAVIAKVQP